MKYCHKKGDVPTGPHYAIVIFSSYTVPGDERSRTAPGHGYPEHSEDMAEYIAFEDRAEWEKEIQRMTTERWPKDFVAISAQQAQIRTNVNVTVS